MYEETFNLEEENYNLEEMIEAAEDFEELEAKEIVHPIPLISTELGKKPVPTDLWDPEYHRLKKCRNRDDNKRRSGEDAARELEHMIELHDPEIKSAEYSEETGEYELKLGLNLRGRYTDIVYETPVNDGTVEAKSLDSSEDYQSLTDRLPNWRTHQ